MQGSLGEKFLLLPVVLEQDGAVFPQLDVGTEGSHLHRILYVDDEGVHLFGSKTGRVGKVTRKSRYADGAAQGRPAQGVTLDPYGHAVQRNRPATGATLAQREEVGRVDA